MNSATECQHIVIDVHEDEGVIKCRVCGAVVSKLPPVPSMTPHQNIVSKGE